MDIDKAMAALTASGCSSDNGSAAAEWLAAQGDRQAHRAAHAEVYATEALLDERQTAATARLCATSTGTRIAAGLELMRRVDAARQQRQ
jgi:hypothetical protein